MLILHIGRWLKQQFIHSTLDLLGWELSVSENGVFLGIVTILTLLSVSMWAPHCRPVRPM